MTNRMINQERVFFILKDFEVQENGSNFSKMRASRLTPCILNLGAT